MDLRSPAEPPHGVPALCADGPAAGTELTVSPSDDGLPPSDIDVDGHRYALAVQSRPVVGRPWRYTVIRDDGLYVVDGGR